MCCKKRISCIYNFRDFSSAWKAISKNKRSNHCWLYVEISGEPYEASTSCKPRLCQVSKWTRTRSKIHKDQSIRTTYSGLESKFQEPIETFEAGLNSDNDDLLSIPVFETAFALKSISHVLNHLHLRFALGQIAQEEARRICALEVDNKLLEAPEAALSKAVKFGFESANEAPKNEPFRFVESQLTGPMHKGVLDERFERNWGNWWEQSTLSNIFSVWALNSSRFVGPDVKFICNKPYDHFRNSE